MKSTRIAIGTAAVSLLACLGALSWPSRAAAAPDTAAACIKVRPEARYRGLGYNHIVHVANVCGSSAECDVSTDVNPSAQHVSVVPRGEVEVTTFLGSPARVFVPNVACAMKP